MSDYFPTTTGGSDPGSQMGTLDDPSSPPKPKGGKLKFELPKVLTGRNGERNRSDLAIEIVNMIYQDEMAAAGLQKAYDEVDELYLGRKVVSLTPLWPGAPTYNAKTLGNKVKQLVNFVAEPMVQLNPYFILKKNGQNGKASAPSQTALHYFLHRGGYELAMSEACNLVTRRGRCPVQVSYVGRRESLDGRVRKAKIKLTPIDLQFARIYPNTAKNPDEARCFGYIYQERVRVCDENQRAGRWIADVKIRHNIQKLQTMAHESPDKQLDSTNSVYRQDDPVDLFEGIIKKDLDGDGFEELYRVVVAKWQRALLRIEPFQLDNTWFADFFFERETGRYRPENCVAMDLADSHHFVNDQLNIAVQGSVYNAAPPMFVDSFALPDEVVETRPGQITTVEGGGKVFSNQGRLDVDASYKLYEIAKNIVDECAKVSQNGLGANLAPGTTATEAAQVAQGQGVGIKGYSSKLALGAIQIADITLELLWRNFDDWYPDYKDVLPSDLTRDELMQEFWIELNGDTPTDTPQAIMQQITTVMQALAQIVQMNPQILQEFPTLLPGLLRAVFETTDIPNKEQILPPAPDEDPQSASDQQQGGGIPGMNPQIQSVIQALQQHAQQQQAGAPGQPTQSPGYGGPIQQPSMGIPQLPMGGQA